MERGFLATIAALLAAFVATHAGPASRPDVKREGSDRIRTGADANAHECECKHYPSKIFAEDFGASTTAQVDDTGDPCKLYSERGELVTPLIATVADPIESHLDAVFDQGLEAIQSGAAALGYDLDRFWLPWTRSHRDGECATVCRETPGVLLFIRHEQGRPRESLAVLLVGETPTTGTNQPSLKKAVAVAQKLNACGQSPERTIPVLGPMFSGSAEPLARTLRGTDRAAQETHSLRERAPASSFTVISGSATADSNLNTFTVRNGIPFHATVNSNETLKKGLLQFVETLGIVPRDVAFLQEENTAYGSSFVKKDRKAADDSLDMTHEPFPAWALSFPMHISELRREYEKGKLQKPAYALGPLELPSSLGLREEDGRQPRDALPQMSPTSLNYAEERLGAILATVMREHIRLVGVVATDTRDKIYLATQMRLHAPDAQIFTFEGDVLLAYPDVRRALYGTIIVSSYPLFADAQLWTTQFDATRSLQQFAGESFEGIYNAVLALLKRQRPHGVQLLDYRCPFGDASAANSRPAIWFSAVGRNGIWPVAVDCKDDVTPQQLAYTYSEAHSAPQCPLEALPVSRLSQLLVGILCAYCIWQWLALAFATGRRGRGGGFMSCALEPYREWETETASSVLPCVAASLARAKLALVTILALVSLALAWIPAVIRAWDPPPGCTRLVLKVTVGWIVPALAVVLGVLLARRAKRRRGIPGGSDRTDVVARSRKSAGIRRWRLAIVSALVAAVLAVAALLPGMRGSRAAWLIFFYRAEHATSGLSPVVPLALLVVPLFVSLSLALRRLRLMDMPLVDGKCGIFGRFTSASLAGAARRDSILEGALGLTRSERVSALLLHRIRETAVPLGAIATLSALMVWSGVRSLEPPRYAWVFLALLLAAVLVLVLMLNRAWRIWNALSDVLESLSGESLEGSLRSAARAFPSTFAKRYMIAGPNMSDLEPLVRRHDTWQRTAGKNDSVAEQFQLDLRHASSAGRSPIPWRSMTYKTLVRHAADAVSDSTGHHDARRKAAKDFLAAHVILAAAWVLSHVRILLAGAVMLAVSILIAPNTYPFQPRRALMLLEWGVLLIAVVSAMVIYAQIERNTLVSWVSGTEPGKLNLDPGFLVHMLTLGVVPLLAFVIVEFPSINEWLGSWLDPVLRSLKTGAP